MENKDLKQVINQLTDIGDIISKLKPYDDGEQEASLIYIDRIKTFLHRQSLSDKFDILDEYALTKIVLKNINNDNIRNIISISDQYTLFTALISLEYCIYIHKSIYESPYTSDKPLIIMLHPDMVLIKKDVVDSFQYCMYNSCSYLLPDLDKIIDPQDKEYFLYMETLETNPICISDHMTRDKLDSVAGIVNSNMNPLSQHLKESLRNYDSNVKRLERFLTNLSDPTTAEKIIWKLTSLMKYYIGYLGDFLVDYYEYEYKEKLQELTESLIKIRESLLQKKFSKDENDKFTEYMKSLLPIKSKSRKEQRAYAACYRFSLAQPDDFPYHDLEELFINMLICDLFEQIIKNYPEFDYRATE